MTSRGDSRQDARTRTAPGDTSTEVVYVAGWGRSGSTLLDMLLGLNDGFVSVGEIKFLWSRGLLENRRCGCGRNVGACEFWRRVLTTAFRSLERADIEWLARMENVTRTRHLPRMLLPGSLSRHGHDLEPYRLVLRRLYEAVSRVAGGTAVVDSSKYPSYLFTLLQTPGINVRVLHLVRDPRAVAYSWSQLKEDPDSPVDAYMPRQHPAATAGYWTGWNYAVERVSRVGGAPRLSVRYEDLASDPLGTMNNVLRWLGRDPSPVGFIDLDQVAMAPSHTVSGNPNRHATGSVQIRVDERWREGLSAAHSRLVMALTQPMRRRLGY